MKPSSLFFYFFAVLFFSLGLLSGRVYGIESGSKGAENKATSFFYISGRAAEITSLPPHLLPNNAWDAITRNEDNNEGSTKSGEEEEDDANPDAPSEILTIYNTEDVIIVELMHERSETSAVAEAIYEDPELYLHWENLLEFMGFGFSEEEQGAYEIASFNGNGALSLDFEAGTYTYEGEEVLLTEEAVALVDGEYYVSENLLNELFELQLLFDVNMQRVELQSDLLFPSELAQRREERRQRLEQRRQQQNPLLSYEAIDNSYSLFDVPFTDVYAQTRVRDYSNTTTATGPTYEWNYNVQGAGDIGYLNSEWSLSGRDSQELERLRFKAGRKSVEPNLLGPLGARSFYVGDLYAPRIDGIVQGQAGRGLEVSNYPIIRSRDFSSTIIRGSVQPGWEVELYRGNLLMDYQTADDQTGEYEFSDAELLYGRNDFKVIAYGPQGEVEERSFSRYVGPGMIEPGKLYYSASFTQHNTPIVELSDRRRITYGDEEPRLFTELEAGISRNLSATAWAYHLPLPDGQHTYVSAGLRSAFRLAGLEASFIKDLQSGHAFKFGTQSRVGSWSLSADHIRMFDGFEMEADLGFRRAYSSTTRARIGGYIGLGIHNSVSVRDYRFDNDRYSTILQHNLRRRFGPLSLTNRLNFSLRDKVENFQYARGDFSARYRINRSITPRAGLRYDFDDDAFEVREINAGLNWYLSEKTSLNTRGGYQFQGLDRGYASAGVNRRFGAFTLGTSAYYATDQNFYANISIRTGFARNPVSGRIRAHDRRVSSSSGLAAQVYHTVPNTNPGREIIASAELLAGTSRRGYTSEDGRSIFRTDLRSWSPQAFKVDEASLRDPAMMPPANGFKYLSRPGKVLVQEIQVQITGEAEGGVFEIDESNREDNLQPLSNVPIQLLKLDESPAEGEEEEQAQAVQTAEETRSAFDGFYLFDRIEEGRYRIEVAPDWLAERELRMLNDVYEFEVIGDGTIFRNIDIVLGPVRDEEEEIDLDRDAFLLTEAERQDLEQELLEQGMMLPCGEEIDFGAIYFGFDQDTISPEARQTIQQHADLMFEYPTLTMLIEGFADQTGNEIYNERLSRRRAWAVQQELVDMGVEPDRMFVRGRGEINEPCEDEDDPGCAEHRKVISMRYTVFEMIFFEQDDPNLTEAQREKLALNLDILRVCQDVNVRVEALSDYLTGTEESFDVVQQRRDEVLEFYIDQGLPEDRLDIELGVGTRFELSEATDIEEGEQNRAQVLTVDANTASFFKADRQRKTYTVQLASSGVLENAREQMQAYAEATGRPTAMYYKPDTDTYIVTLAIEGSSFQAERELYRLRRDIEFRSAFLVPMDGLQDAQLGTEGLYEVRFGAFSSDEAAERVRDYINSFSSEEAVVVYNERDDVYRVIARNALERDEAVFIIDEARENGHNDLLILRLNELE